MRILNFRSISTKIFVSTTIKPVKSHPDVFQIDGKKSQTLEDLFDRMCDAFSLPNYFGRNFDALSEVLSDLSWLERDKYVFVIKNAEMLLKREDVFVLETFLKVMESVSEEWSDDICMGEVWDRKAKSFLILLLSKNSRRKKFSKHYSKLNVEMFDLGF